MFNFWKSWQIVSIGRFSVSVLCSSVKVLVLWVGLCGLFGQLWLLLQCCGLILLIVLVNSRLLSLISQLLVGNGGCRFGNIIGVILVVLVSVCMYFLLVIVKWWWLSMVLLVGRFIQGRWCMGRFFGVWICYLLFGNGGKLLFLYCSCYVLVKLWG